MDEFGPRTMAGDVARGRMVESELERKMLDDDGGVVSGYGDSVIVR